MRCVKVGYIWVLPKVSLHSMLELNPVEDLCRPFLSGPYNYIVDTDGVYNFYKCLANNRDTVVNMYYLVSKSQDFYSIFLQSLLSGLISLVCNEGQKNTPHQVFINLPYDKIHVENEIIDFKVLVDADAISSTKKLSLIWYYLETSYKHEKILQDNNLSKIYMWLCTQNGNMVDLLSIPIIKPVESIAKLILLRLVTIRPSVVNTSKIILECPA